MLRLSLYSFSMCFPADFSISFLLPTWSKATSTSASPPMGRTDSTIPCPKAVWRTMSPFSSCIRPAAGAAFFWAEAKGRCRGACSAR